jgi:hypothetical protein
MEIAERIRCAVAERHFEVDTAAEPIHATVSVGVAAFPRDGMESTDLMHKADLAVYRAKLQGRNRVVNASSEPLLLPPDRADKLRAVVDEVAYTIPLPTRESAAPSEDRRSSPRPLPGAAFLRLSRGLTVVVAAVSLAGIGAGIAGFVAGTASDSVGLIAVLALVAAGQALSFELAEVEGSLSVSVVGSLAGASLFGYRAALPLAIVIAVVDWSARRNSLHTVVYNVGAISLSSLAAAFVFSAWEGTGNAEQLATVGLGLAAGAVYFVVNMGLLSVASGVESHESPWMLFSGRFLWLLPHYVVYGFIGAVTHSPSSPCR